MDSQSSDAPATFRQKSSAKKTVQEISNYRNRCPITNAFIFPLSQFICLSKKNQNFLEKHLIL
nr:MAG TPA: hypothetical protein [Caudoviricetes sp.]